MLTSGFFNALNSDRRYDAEQISSIFDGVIGDGVYETVGDRFQVTPGDGMEVYVGSGRAWFDHTWTNNTAGIPLQLDPSENGLDRIDLVVLEVNRSEEVRENSIKVLTGVPGSTPVRPEPTKDDWVKQYPLAEIYVAAGVGSISVSAITNKIGTSECPFVIGVVSIMTIDQIVRQWGSEWDETTDAQKAEFRQWMVDNEAEFRAWYGPFVANSEAEFNTWYNTFTPSSEAQFRNWFANLQYVLDGDVAGHLQNEIDNLDVTRGMTNSEIDAVWASVFGV